MSKLSTIEKKFEITKFLHSKRKMSELERIFDLSDKQVRNLIKDEKVRFLNVEFPLFKRKVKQHGDNVFVSDSETYEKLEDIHDPSLRSTVNPVVLPLNMTEVYALTERILDITEGTPDYKFYRRIAEMIYNQLSDYAKKQIMIDTDKHWIERVDTIKFEKETTETDRQFSDVLMHSLKSRQKLRITLRGGRIITGLYRPEFDDFYIITDTEKIKYSDISHDVIYMEIANN